MYEASVRLRALALSSGLALSCVLAALFWDAGTSAPAAPTAQRGPTITTLTPSTGPLGTLITIRGANFTARGNQLEFRSAETSFRAGSEIDSSDGISLEARVSPCPTLEPQCPTYYVPPGVYAVTVTNAGGTSNEASFLLTRP